MGEIRKNKSGMILAIDIGNSNVVIGCIDKDKTCFKESIETDRRKTKLEYAIVFKTLLELNNISPDKIDGAIVSSVVPPLTNVITESVLMTTGLKSIVVAPGVKTGVPIRMDDPRTVGADLIATAAGAAAEYGTPVIIIDIGTATTITVVDKKGAYIGGVIMPGVRTSLDSLSGKAAQLPYISMEEAPCVIGKNTIDSMQSGIINGHASSIDGMIERFENELGEEYKGTTVVATGGMADIIISNCKRDVIIDGDLLLKGLKCIYDRNI